MIKIRKFKLGILGFSGRMGREVDELLEESRFQARLENVAAPGSGMSLDPLFKAEVWLEFSSPAAVLILCREALRRKSKIPLVVGATGWSAAELAELEMAAREFPILRASNFSLGVQLCRLALRAWGSFSEVQGWTVIIRDVHHARKKDAPSGTALSLREAFGTDVEITSVREGETIGRHEITLESDREKIILIHEAKSRAVFAEGALETVLRLANADLSALPKRILGLDDLYLHRGA